MVMTDGRQGIGDLEKRVEWEEGEEEGERKGIEEQAHHLVNGERRCEKSSVPCETNLVRELDKGDARAVVDRPGLIQAHG
jgi:hypothetical protein